MAKVNIKDFILKTKLSNTNQERESGETTKLNVFAGGDAVTGAATVISAMGAGKLAAEAIDKKLK